MAQNNFDVTSYFVRIGDAMSATFNGTTIQARGILVCQGADNQRIVVYFLSGSSPVPSATITQNGKWGVLFLPHDLMGVWIDLVRNEKPLVGVINTSSPQSTYVTTSVEPVGEGET